VTVDLEVVDVGVLPEEAAEMVEEEETETTIVGEEMTRMKEEEEEEQEIVFNHVVDEMVVEEAEAHLKILVPMDTTTSCLKMLDQTNQIYQRKKLTSYSRNVCNANWSAILDKPMKFKMNYFIMVSLFMTVIRNGEPTVWDLATVEEENGDMMIPILDEPKAVALISMDPIKCLISHCH